MVKYVTKDYHCPISTSGQQYIYKQNIVSDMTPLGHTPIGSTCVLISGQTDHISNIFAYENSWVATVSDLASVGEVFGFRITVFYI